MNVQLFATCLVDSLFPEVGEAIAVVLAQAGEQVEFPAGQTCCGQPAYNAGFHAESARMARHTIEVLDASPHPVVVPSGSCAAMIRHGYAEVFAGDPLWLARSRALAERTFEFSEYLADRDRPLDAPPPFRGVIAYHASCHLLRGLGVDRQPKALLRRVPGATIEALPNECCGFGGFFSVEQPEISSEMLTRKLDQIAACGARVVVSCDASCLMHLEGGLRRSGSRVRCAHLAQVLADREAGLR